MTTNASEVLSQSDAQEALQLLDQNAAVAAASLQADGGAVAQAADAHVLEATTDARIEVLRNRAKRQRLRGIQSLERRHDGVASIMRDIELKERVVGSSFQRYFATIEGGIHFLSKLGAFFVGDSNAEKLLDSIKDMVTDMEKRVKEENARMDTVLAVHAQAAHWVVPVYTGVSAQHQVQIRTPLANKVASIFVAQDSYLQKLQQMVWNGEQEVDEIEIAELQLKKDARALATFIAKTLRGIQNKTAPKKKEATDQPAAAPASADVPSEEEAVPA